MLGYLIQTHVFYLALMFESVPSKLEYVRNIALKKDYTLIDNSKSHEVMLIV